MNNLFVLIVVVLGLSLFFWGKKKEIPELTLAIFSALINLGALISFLLVVTPLVPAEMKDGRYGSVGGILLGSGFVRLALFIVSLSKIIRKRQGE